MRTAVHITGKERTFPVDEIIVSKTDLGGRILYANDIFLEISGYTEEEVIGRPHNIIRHPHMPRCVFKLLWETIETGSEIFGYVVNRAKNGDHYWVLAHATPTFDATGTIVGYHSSRRVASQAALRIIEPLYAKLLAEEARHKDRKEGLAASWKMLNDILDQKGMPYDAFIFSIINA